MEFVSYSQNLEDVMLWRALRHIEKGFYIDIGAQDPLVDSVSLAFHERGWRGIHVEPNPQFAELLRQQRPGDVVVQAAVGDISGLITLYVIPGSGLSTADEKIAAKHRQSGFDVQSATVPCLTLASVFDSCRSEQVHWLKLDIEGFEAKALSSWGASPLRPWIVVVESTLPLTQIESSTEWEPMLLHRGYEPVYFDGLNRYYLAKDHLDLRSAFLAPPNYFDHFAVNGTASTSLHALIQRRHLDEIARLVAAEAAAQQAAELSIQQLTESLQSTQNELAESRSISAGLRDERSVMQSEMYQKELAITERLNDIAIAVDRTTGLEKTVADLTANLCEAQAALSQAQDEHSSEISALERACQLAASERDNERLDFECRQTAADHEASARADEFLQLREQFLEAESLGKELQESLTAVQMALVLEVQRQAAAVTAIEFERRALGASLTAQHEAQRQVADILSRSRSVEARYADRIQDLQERLNFAIDQAAVQLNMRRALASNPTAALEGLLPPVDGDEESDEISEQIFEKQLFEAPLDRTLQVLDLPAAAFTQSISRSVQMPAQSTPPSPIVHLHQLLALHGEAFVDAAYRVLLGRESDPHGGEYFRTRVATDHDKAAVVYELATSPEGRLRAQSLPGLAELVGTAKPRGGRIRRWLQRLARVDTGLLRITASVSALGDESIAQLTELSSRLDALTAELRKSQTESERQLQKLTAAISAQSNATGDFERRLVDALLTSGRGHAVTGTGRQSAIDLQLHAEAGPRQFLETLARKLLQSSEATALSGHR